MTRKAGLNSNTLKLLAVVAMICQHVTIFFIPTTNPWYDPLFCFGMITAPIMCFFIAEGYYHTHSRRKYLELLLLYNGQRGRKSKWYQWGYYLIYPIHLMVLYVIELLYDKKPGVPPARCTCQEKVDTKKGKITGSPVRSCTELGFCSPRQQPDGDD